MDAQYSAAMAELGTRITTLAVKGTASAIYNKIKAIKDEKNAERLHQTYGEIISELLSERDEAVQIGQVYKAELERIQISDDDIERLNDTIGRILEVAKVWEPDAPIEAIGAFRKFINADTLKAMQLLGFNYKAAFGEPLTQACANWISTKLAPPEQASASRQKRAARK